jgi:hypothetical protein
MLYDKLGEILFAALANLVSLKQIYLKIVRNEKKIWIIDK